MIPVCINNAPLPPPVRQAPGRKSAVEQEKCGGVGVSRLGVSSSLKGIHVPVAFQRVE